MTSGHPGVGRRGPKGAIRFALAFLGAATVSSVLAQSGAIDMDRLYVSDPAACEAIERDGVAGIDEGVTLLSFEDGIQSFEFHCQFFDVKTRDSSSFVLVEAICEEPGLRFPDLLSVAPYDDRTIEVVSLHDSALDTARDENPEVGTSYYTRCDNLDGLPRN